jgi:hypothetical protein
MRVNIALQPSQQQYVYSEMATPVNGSCRLCLQEKKLVKAHIIPEHFYTNLYNEKGQYVEVHVNKDKSERTKKRLKGIWDNTILCGDCDNTILGKLDDYAAKIFWGYRNQQLNIKEFQRPDQPLVQWRTAYGIDTARIKLFFLSVLWRAHISKNVFFKDVDLETEDCDKIRSMIMENNPGTRDDYPILLLHYSRKDTEARKVISQIFRYQQDALPYYGAIMSGLLVLWYIRPNPMTKKFKSMILSGDNDLHILSSPTQGYNFLAKFTGLGNG